MAVGDSTILGTYSFQAKQLHMCLGKRKQPRPSTCEGRPDSYTSLQLSKSSSN
jgi:hypothetical protein